MDRILWDLKFPFYIFLTLMLQTYCINLFVNFLRFHKWCISSHFDSKMDSITCQSLLMKNWYHIINTSGPLLFLQIMCSITDWTIVGVVIDSMINLLSNDEFRFINPSLLQTLFLLFKTILSGICLLRFDFENW